MPPKKIAPNISVIVCTYNRANLLTDCLHSLVDQTIDKLHYEVIVVDNNSTDSTQKVAQDFAIKHDNFKVLLERQQGKGYALNTGITNASGEYIAFIDDDAQADPDWLERIGNAFKIVNPTPIAVGGEIYPKFENPPPCWFDDQTEYRSKGPEKGFLKGPKARFGFSGSNVTIRKDIILKHGGFSTHIGPQGNKFSLGEDVEFFYRISSLNPHLWYDPEIRVQHWVPVKKMDIRYRLWRAYLVGIATSKITGRNRSVIIQFWRLCVGCLILPFRIRWWDGCWQKSFYKYASRVAVDIGYLKYAISTTKIGFRNKFSYLKLFLRIKANNILGRDLKIILGAGKTICEGWTSTNEAQLDITDKQAWERFFRAGTITALMAEHVWEHLDTEGAIRAAGNCFTFLKDGGYLRVAVPDGNFPDPEYIENVRAMGSGRGSQDHRQLYTYQSLSEIFQGVGFEITPLEYWDDNGEFHYVLWDTEDGLIRRSRFQDPRNKDDKIRYTSIIVDAVKR